MDIISLEQARQAVYEYTGRMGTEMVEITDACGRILAEDVRAEIDQPPFVRSAMDGYAVRVEDVAYASRDNPIELSVAYKLCAGDAPGQEIASSQTVRIMTGAAVPEGADCVVRQEDTDCGEERVRIFAGGKKGQNCCPRGEDFKRGELLLTCGSKLDCFGIATVAAAGRDCVLVYRRPKVLLVTTGDELCPPGVSLEPGKIYNSGAAYFTARLKKMGCKLEKTVTTGDDMEEICSHMLKSANEAELIVTTGGVSVGQKDLLEDVMKHIGAKIIFHGIALKPGMPSMFSVLGNTPILSLSGNPYSAIAVFELLMQPFLKKCTGQKNEMIYRNATVEGVFSKSSPARRMIKGHFDGEKVRISEEQGNGQLKSGIGCNCLVDISAGSGPVSFGDEVRVILI